MPAKQSLNPSSWPISRKVGLPPFLGARASRHGILCLRLSAVLIGHIAGATKSIRVGSGGVMLFNHAPLVIAEQFGILASIYPARIDLGVGRAVGSATPKGPFTRKPCGGPSGHRRQFPQACGGTSALPWSRAAGPNDSSLSGTKYTRSDLFLSSSGYNAQLAGELGLPLAFATHIKPDI